ncbi:hypothetical protein FCULG_00005077 [Fusarium culmorum]|uniref:Uncharacterized protein n=1 Tax=Fusarium culmorum TaxID=5516 RepID=A0A2T4HCA5_FUSCU|nr:hypothetical protein FCULG_00005077 [Fusarium culmorum]
MAPIIRLAIDSKGINRVERLCSIPAYVGERNTSFRYIVQHASLVTGIEAQVKDGLLRLKLPDERPDLPIWNTPSPPDLSSCITFFFFSSGHLFGTHFHYEQDSSAVTTYECFDKRRQKSIIWVYLPMPKNDRLLVLGVRHGLRSKTNILVRTRQIGDIIIGRHTTGEFRDICLAKSAPVTIVYNEPPEGYIVNYFGAYCRSPDRLELSTPFPLERCSPHPLGDESYFSWAPLDRVSSTLTFNDPKTDIAKV